MSQRSSFAFLLLAALGVHTSAPAQIISSFERSVTAPLFSIEGMARAGQVAPDQGACVFASNALIGPLGDADILLLRVNGMGTIVRDLVIGDGGGQGYHDVAKEVVQADKHYFITGHTRAIDTSSAHTFTALLIKVDTALNFIRQTNYIMPAGEMYGEALTPYGAFDLLMAGKIYDGNDFNTFVMRVDSAGDPVWIKQYAISFGETVECIRQLPGGDILLSGSVILGFELVLPFVCKLNAAGDFLWGKYYNHPLGFVERSSFQFIHVSSVNSIQLTGYTDKFGAGATDLYVVEIDSSGAVNWARTYGGPQFEEPTMAQFDDATNELVLVGSSGSFTSSGAPVPLAVRLAPNGLVLAAALYGDTSVYQAGRFHHSCRVGPQSNLLMGSRDFPADDLYLVGSDSDMANGCAHHPVVLSVANQSTTPAPFTTVVSVPVPLVNDSALALSTFNNSVLLCDLATAVPDRLPQQTGLTVYPTPGDGAFQLSVPHGFVPDVVRVNDMQGRTVHTTTAWHAVVQLPATLAPGMYHVQVSDRTGRQLGAVYQLH